MRTRPALVVALAASLLACRNADGPAERYRAFAAAAAEGAQSTGPGAHDEAAAAVWSMLSEKTRSALDARARALAAQVPAGVVPTSGKDLVLGDLAAQVAPPRSIVVVRESADAAVLSVETDGAPPREVTLVREGGAWRVVLPFDN